MPFIALILIRLHESGLTATYPQRA